MRRGNAALPRRRASSRLLVEAGRDEVEIGTKCRAGYHFAAFNLGQSAVAIGIARRAIDGLFGGAETAKKAANSEVVMRSNTGMCLVAIGAALALAGCSSGARQPLGLTEGSPDESQALARAPLTPPP